MPIRRVGGRSMKAMGLRAKLAMGFGTLLAMLILTGLVGYHSTGKVIAAAEDVTFSLKRKEVATAIELGVRKQIQSASGYVFNGDQASLSQYGQDKQDVAQRLSELSKMLSTEKDKSLFSKIQQSTDRMTVITEQEISFSRENRSYEANDLASGPKTQQIMTAIAPDSSHLEASADTLGQEHPTIEH